jgi:hypothetical protein
VGVFVVVTSSVSFIRLRLLLIALVSELRIEKEMQIAVRLIRTRGNAPDAGSDDNLTRNQVFDLRYGFFINACPRICIDRVWSETFVG